VLQARQLRDLGAKYAPRLVVQAFDMTDFHDDLVARERLARMRAGGGGEASIFRAFGVGASLALGVEDYGEWLGERLRGRPAARAPPGAPGGRRPRRALREVLLPVPAARSVRAVLPDELGGHPGNRTPRPRNGGALRPLRSPALPAVRSAGEPAGPRAAGVPARCRRPPRSLRVLPGPGPDRGVSPPFAARGLPGRPRAPQRPGGRPPPQRRKPPGGRGTRPSA